VAAPPALRRISVRDRLGRAVATTPGRIAGGFVLVVAAALLAGAVNLVAATNAATSIRIVGRDAEPSVVLALQIGAVMADLDATATNDALAAGVSAAGTSRRWRDGKAELDRLVIEASRNITYPDETIALQGVLRWTGEYHAALAEARDAADPARPFISIQRLQWSHRLLRNFALPQADALAAANRKPLLDGYDAYRTSSWRDGGAAALTVALLAAILVVLQVFLTRRTRRLVNAPAAAATLLGLCIIGGLLAVTLKERESLRAARFDCYDSLDPLYSAKVVAAEMNADLSLWLLDPAGRAAASQAFDTEARALLDLDWRDVSTVNRYRAELDGAQGIERRGEAANALAAVHAKGGLLGKELANITFGVAERDPATEAVRSLLAFLQVADRLRKLTSPSQMAEAVQLREGPGAQALARLTSALDATIGVNQVEFDRDIREARHLVGLTPGIACGALLAAVLLAAAGLWQRYREYA